MHTLSKSLFVQVKMYSFGKLLEIWFEKGCIPVIIKVAFFWIYQGGNIPAFCQSGMIFSIKPRSDNPFVIILEYDG